MMTGSWCPSPPCWMQKKSALSQLLICLTPPPLFSISEVWNLSMKIYVDWWANTTKNTDAVGLGCYDKSTCLVNCLDLSTIEKPWKICGSPMTFGMSTWLEKIETFSWKWLIISKHIFAYARVTGPGQFTKRLFKLYAEAGHAHQGVCLVRLHHWTISSSNIIAIVEDYSEEVEDFKSE